MDPKQKKRLLWQLPFLTLLIVGTVVIIRQQQNVPYRTCSGTIFSTTYNITYQYGDDLQPQLTACMLQIDSALSMFNQESLVARINRNENVKPNELFLNVFKLAQQISKDTDGAFDITVAPLVNIWGFGFKRGQNPSSQAIDSIMPFVGYQKVSYDGQHIRKSDPRIMIDCSAIAKGYAVDVVASLLRARGIENYLVEIGGEVITHGISERRLPWRIGVTKPTDEAATSQGELQAVLNVTDRAMATSGNYRNFYYKGGRKYAHTIDPKTGHPVQHNILSATVLADQCAMADAYATAFMVMGLERAQELLSRHPELMAYIIYDDHGHNAVWYSKSLHDKIQQ
jgi:thiamine biosynthesis lipoprotein